MRRGSQRLCLQECRREGEGEERESERGGNGSPTDHVFAPTSVEPCSTLTRNDSKFPRHDFKIQQHLMFAKLNLKN